MSRGTDEEELSRESQEVEAVSQELKSLEASEA